MHGFSTDGGGLIVGGGHIGGITGGKPGGTMGGGNGGKPGGTMAGGYGGKRGGN